MKLQPTGDKKLDAALARMAKGEPAQPPKRRALVRKLAAWPGEQVTPALVELLQSAAAKLEDIGYYKKSLQAPFLAMRMAAMALARRKDPKAEDALLQLWRESDSRSMARHHAARTLLGRADPLDDGGHAIKEFEPSLVASARTLARLAKLAGSKDADTSFTATFLQDPKRSFDALGRYLRPPHTTAARNLQILLTGLLARHPFVLHDAGDLRWKAALEELARQDPNKETWAATAIENAWGKR